MKRTVDTKFYTFRQNNSGGYHDLDPEKGIGNYVIIEAINSDDACNRAEDIGLYFGGGGDCPCCGDRWDRPWDSDDAKEEPSIYGEPVEKFLEDKSMAWWDETIYIHYYDGKVESFEKKREP